jgi:hypothetical protein
MTIDPSPAPEPKKSTVDRATTTRLDTLAVVVACASLLVTLSLGVFTLVQTGQADDRADQQQRAERLAAGAGLLGADSAGGRIGGIRALERLARDSPEDRVVVLDLLTGHLADQIGRSHDADECAPPWHGVPARRDATESLAAVMRLYDDQRLVLSELCLTGATELRGRDLSGADLTGSRFDGADLTGTDLDCADLTTAFFQNTVLDHTRLAGAVLAGAVIKKVPTPVDPLTGRAPSPPPLVALDLRRADLRAARFVNESGTDFVISADITGARWDGATVGPTADGGRALPGGFGSLRPVAATGPVPVCG